MTNEPARQAADLQISKLKNLPALPETSIKILDAINDPGIDIGELVKVISLSPSLVARMLGLANSAFFGQSKQIEDLHTGIVRVLGLQLVKSLTLGILLNVQLDPRNCKRFDRHWFWQHSLMTAIGAQKVASQCKPLDVSASTAYTAGLLLNIGLLVAAFAFPDELDALLVEEAKGMAQISHRVMQYFGKSHYQMGYLLLKQWRLPDIYLTAVRQFDGGESEPYSARLNRCIQAGHYIACLILDEDSALLGLAQISEQTDLPLELVENVYCALLEQKDNVQRLATGLGS